MTIIIKEVKGHKLLKKFITFPQKLYEDSPYWVPPIIADEFVTLKKSSNPAFKQCEACYFLAYKGEEIVGRVAAIINFNANKDWNEKSVRFGWFDFIDDLEVSKELLRAVATWGKERGMDMMKGPLGFSDMDKEGMLIEGFDKLPSITTLYNYPYYVDHMVKLGLVKDADWIQRYVSPPDEIPERIAAFSSIIQKRYQLKIFKPKNRKDLKKRGLEMFSVLNESFVPLYEFTKLNQEQKKSYVNQYVPILNKDLICIVLDRNDKVIAFAILIPSLSVAQQKTKGRLFPFGFIHMLRGLKKMEYLEMSLIGIAPEYQQKGVNAIIFNHLHRNCLKYKVNKVVANPQLEENIAVQALFDDYPMQPYQIRRCYKIPVESIT